MTEEKQPHEGEIWRTLGSMYWCHIILKDKTPEGEDYDGGLSGFVMKLGRYSFKRKRAYWHSTTYFVAAANYDDFVAQMKGERRYLVHGEMEKRKNEK